MQMTRDLFSVGYAADIWYSGQQERFKHERRAVCDCYQATFFPADHLRTCTRLVERCIVCGGQGEGMPHSCPGRKMTCDEIERVEAGKLNYIHGQWIKDFT